MNAIVDLSVIVGEARLSDPAVVAEIDAWVCAQPGSTPFHRPAWIMGVEAGTGQKAVMLVGRTPSGEINGVLPLTHIRSALFGKALVGSGFAVDGGILASHRKAIAKLADAAWYQAERLGCDTLELRGGEAPGGASWQNKADAYLGFSRALAADDEAELKAIPKRHRAEIRKGLGNDLQFETGRDQRLRDIHYRLYCQSSIISARRSSRARCSMPSLTGSGRMRTSPWYRRTASPCRRSSASIMAAPACPIGMAPGWRHGRCAPTKSFISP